MTAATNRLTFSPHWPDTHGGPTDKSVSSNWQIDSLCQLLTNPAEREALMVMLELIIQDRTVSQAAAGLNGARRLMRAV